MLSSASRPAINGVLSIGAWEVTEDILTRGRRIAERSAATPAHIEEDYMQAMHGLALPRLRSRVIGSCITGIALALAALALAFASTARAAEPPQKTYLASGASVAFGYSQGLFNEN